MLHYQSKMLHYQNEIVFLKEYNPTLWEELIQYLKKNKLIVSECCHFYLIYLSPEDNKGYEKLTNKMSSTSDEEYKLKEYAQKADSITINGLCNILARYYGFYSHLFFKIKKWWEDNKQTILVNHYNLILDQNYITPDSVKNESVLKRDITKLSESYSNLLNNSNALQTSFDQLKEENIVLKKDKSSMNDTNYYKNDQPHQDITTVKGLKEWMKNHPLNRPNALQPSDQLKLEHVFNFWKNDTAAMKDTIDNIKVQSDQQITKLEENYSNLLNSSAVLQTSFDQLKEEHRLLKYHKSSMKDSNYKITKLKEKYSNLLNSSAVLQTSFDQLKEETSVLYYLKNNSNALQTSIDQLNEDVDQLKKENTVLNNEKSDMKDNFKKMEKLTEENETLKVENCSLNNKMTQLKNLF